MVRYANKDSCTKRFIEAFILVKKWKHTKYPKTWKWLNKLQYTFMKGYYAANKNVAQNCY